MGVLCRLVGSAGFVLAFTVYFLASTDESVAVNVRYGIPVFAFLGLWAVGVVGEARNALEKGLGTDVWNEKEG